jgi:hypothetical protein
MSSAPTIEAANGVTPEPPRPTTLRDLAARLTPNPALTIDGTLQILLSGIDNIADEDLARALACANASHLAGGQLPPLTDDEWKAGGIEEKLMLIRAAKALKHALRLMAE